MPSYFNRYKGLVKYWLTFNEINMILHAPFMGAGLYFEEGDNVEQVKYQAAHHELLASAIATKIAHEVDPENKVGCMLAAGAYYPYTSKPEDVWAARMNDNFKIELRSRNVLFWRIPRLLSRVFDQMRHLSRNTAEDQAILKAAKPDFIALNYYRTLVASYLPTDEQHPLGTKEKDIDFDLYGYFKIEKNQHLKTSKYGVQN